MNLSPCVKTVCTVFMQWNILTYHHCFNIIQLTILFLLLNVMFMYTSLENVCLLGKYFYVCNRNTFHSEVHVHLYELSCSQHLSVTFFAISMWTFKSIWIIKLIRNYYLCFLRNYIKYLSMSNFDQVICVLPDFQFLLYGVTILL